MKLAYITYSTPCGFAEVFILKEMGYVKKVCRDILIVPLTPSKTVFHKNGELLLPNALLLPLINLRMVLYLTKIFLKNPKLVVSVIKKIFKYSRTLRIALKNLIVLPKSIYISHILTSKNISHIHVHWGTATATMGYIVSELTNIPWSFTLHRWDIYENNMLKEKVKSAEFVRCISEKGKRDLINIIGNRYANKIYIIHLGIEIKPRDILYFRDKFRDWSNKKMFIIAVPANLVTIKGHKYLIDACSILIEKGIKNIRFIFFGDGPLKKALNKYIYKKRLSEFITLYGSIPQEVLFNKYRMGEIDIVILPSITIKEGEHEGIPASLFEAMSFGIPVISTNTGSIPELLSNGSGTIVREKSANELENAINSIISDRKLAMISAIKSYERVSVAFDISKNTNSLLKIIKERIYNESE